MLRNPHFKARDDEKEAYLVMAIRNKHPELAEVFIRHGVSPDALHPLYGPAIVNASQAGPRKLVKHLIQAVANVNKWHEDDDCCKTALSAASEHGHLEIVRDLLKAGAHLGLQDSVKLALENGHTTIVELLSDRVCRVRRVNVDLLESAASYGTIELVQRLLDTKPNGRGKSAALSKACESGRAEIVSLLLSEGAEVNTDYPWYLDGADLQPKEIETIHFQDNALVLAVKSGNENILQMVLDRIFGRDQVAELTEDFKFAKFGFANHGLPIYMKKALVKALAGCHQRALTALLDALVNHDGKKEYEYDTLRVASQVQNQQVLQDFSVLIGEKRHPYFEETMFHLHEILLGDYRLILQSLLKEAGENYLQYRDEDESADVVPPIEVAVSIGNATIVEQFIQAGIDINLDETLCDAARNQHGHIVKLLLDYKNNTKSNTKLSVVHLFENALMCGKESDCSIAHMLLDHGVIDDYSEENGTTPLHLASLSGCITIVERLLNLGHTVDKKDCLDRTPLHSALRKDVINALVSAGADLNARDFQGWTPLHTAAEAASPEAVGILLQSGAHIFALTNDKRTALQVVTSYGSDVIETIKILLGNGLDVNDRDERGSSALHNACSQSSVKVAALLLVKGADVNVKDNKGITPLHLAICPYVTRATFDLVSLLVDHGCDVNTQDKKGFTALHHVYTECHYERGFSYPYLVADVAELLLDHGVHIDARDVEGKTALFRFLERGALAGVELLIEKGADVKALTNCGKTMIHAMRDDTLSLCPILQERGVDINALTTGGWSALAIALQSGSFYKIELPKMLAEQGGKNIRNWREEEYRLKK
ncbi:Pfs NACHT ankyrin domain-containing protein [Fusarium coicis]|nr:Pfs NACHT ankyrin domain-containing protein [Fusarium coicis]